jgi:hypothetical protein
LIFCFIASASADKENEEFNMIKTAIKKTAILFCMLASQNLDPTREINDEYQATAGFANHQSK